MKKLDDSKIKKPDTIYGTVPFWAWNGTMTRENICKTIEELKENGFGGAFVHPRPGLTNEYLSEEWFELWKIALDEAKRQELKLYIYDENTYPTGYAGGHIMSQIPDCAARCVKVRIYESLNTLMEFLKDPKLCEEERNLIRLYRARSGGGKIEIIEEVTDTPQKELEESTDIFIGASYMQPYSSVWYGGFPNSDILRPEVTRMLLDCTYEEYYKRFHKDFGEQIPAIFSDEPGISPGNVNLEDPMVFPFSRYLAAQFYERRGYSLEDNMVGLVLDITGTKQGMAASKVRFDYYFTLHELWVENFAVPISKWCEEHHVAWTGHFLDEHWPYPWGCCSPSVMSMYEYMQWPGIDMLMTHMLKEDGKSPMLLSVKELESAGTQLGKERLLCECYGAGGWDAKITDFKRIGDWLAVHGITFFNQHLTLSSLRGVRKHGHPQSFDAREPWWEEYGKLTPYYARLSYLLSQGRTQHSILLLHPTTTWYLKEPHIQKGNILWDFNAMPEQEPVKTYIELLQELTAKNIGYDLGDEFLLQNHGKIQDGKLRVGEADYKTLVIPKEMEHMVTSTFELIEMALKEGIEVICLGEFPHYKDGCEWCDGRPSVVHMGQQQFVEAMLTDKRQIIPIQGEGIACKRKTLLSGEELCFLTNSTPVGQECKIEFPDALIYEINLFSGEKEIFLAPKRGESVTIHLNTCESRMFYWEMHDGGYEKEQFVPGASQDAVLGIITKEASDTSFDKVTNTAQEDWEETVLLLEKAVLKGDNVLVLDYGTLHLKDKVYENIHVMAACEKIFHAHGMEQNPWDMAIQFKRQYIDRNHFSENSGFEMCYYFETDEIPSNLLLAFEQPGLCSVEINGIKVEWDGETTWLDEEFGLINIKEYVIKGRNEILIKVCPFDLDVELQPIYILGNFSLDIREEKFIIARQKALMLGGLKEQGAIFYGGRVTYDFNLCWEESDAKAGLLLNDYEATALSIYVNGTYVAQAGIGAGDVFQIEDYLSLGNNRITLELSCSLKNLFGPFHTDDVIRNSAWPAAWKQAPRHGMPSPKKYDTIDYGLFGKIILRRERKI